MRIEFRDPSGTIQKKLDIDKLKAFVLAYPSPYWRQQSGTAGFRAYFTNGEERSLIIGQNVRHGFYLQYQAKDTFLLSLGDRSKLDVVDTCAEEWTCSIGLFVPPEVAWLAIEEFVRAGKATTKIEWIEPSELPESGDY